MAESKNARGSTIFQGDPIVTIGDGLSHLGREQLYIAIFCATKGDLYSQGLSCILGALLNRTEEPIIDEWRQ
jgi:hypothetical protein